MEQWCLQHLFDSPLMLPRTPNARAATLGRRGGAALMWWCFSALACLRTTNPLYNRLSEDSVNLPSCRNAGGKTNIILSLDQILLSNPGLWPFGPSSRSGIEFRVELEGFLEQTDRRPLRNSDLHSPPYAAAGHTLGRHGAAD